MIRKRRIKKSVKIIGSIFIIAIILLIILINYLTKINSINYKLGTLANYFNVSYEGAHRGLKDVEITYEVYNCLRRLI